MTHMYEHGKAHCPACGMIDYCPGHDEIGDPYGAETLRLHDADVHNVCHPNSECKN